MPGGDASWRDDEIVAPHWIVHPPKVLGDGERDVLFAQQPEEAAVGRGVVCGHQKDAGRVLLADIQILVSRMPLENRLGGQEPGSVLLRMVPTTATAGGPPCAMF